MDHAAPLLPRGPRVGKFCLQHENELGELHESQQLWTQLRAPTPVLKIDTFVKEAAPAFSGGRAWAPILACGMVVACLACAHADKACTSSAQVPEHADRISTPRPCEWSEFRAAGAHWNTWRAGQDMLLDRGMDVQSKVPYETTASVTQFLPNRTSRSIF